MATSRRLSLPVSYNARTLGPGCQMAEEPVGSRTRTMFKLALDGFLFGFVFNAVWIMAI
jgi:hypothetical protein